MPPPLQNFLTPQTRATTASPEKYFLFKETTSTRRRPPSYRASCSAITSASLTDSSMFTRPVHNFFWGISWNLIKERYLSKTHFLTFVYLSKCIINLPCYFGNSKKRFFVNRSSVQCEGSILISAKPLLVCWSQGDNDRSIFLMTVTYF